MANPYNPYSQRYGYTEPSYPMKPQSSYPQDLAPSHGGRNSTYYIQVDSWRSYRNDASSSLQYTSQDGAWSNTRASNYNLNPSATSFVPSNATPYVPYQPLRLSGGNQERKVIEQARTNNQSVLPTRSLSSRYLVRSNRGIAGQVLPSIEQPDLDQSIINKVLVETPRIRRPQTPTRRSTPRRTVSPPAPQVTVDYLSAADVEPETVSEPRKLLVVLDLNGTLLYRSSKGPNSKVHMRPGVTPFLDYLFDNHVVMVYTSTMPLTAENMVKQFLSPTRRNQLAAIWARDKLELNEAQYRGKVQVYKKLDKVWADEDIQKTPEPGMRWDQSNTILVDDSKLKALSQPHNLLQVLEYTNKDSPGVAGEKALQDERIKKQSEILQQLQMKLEELKYQRNVSALIRKWQTGDLPVPQVAGQEMVVEESVDQKQVEFEEDLKEHIEAAKDNSQLLTPDSMTNTGTAESPVKISDDERDQKKGEKQKERSDSVSSVGSDVFKDLLAGI